MPSERWHAASWLLAWQCLLVLTFAVLASALSPPRDLRISFGDSSLTVKWNAPLDSISPTSYALECVKSSTVIANVNQFYTATSYTFTGLTNGQVYDVSIQAIFLSGPSEKAYFAQLAPRAPKRFIGASGGFWGVSSNWDGGSLPSADDVVLFNGGVVTVDSDVIVAGVVANGTTEATVQCGNTASSGASAALRTGFTRGLVLLAIGTTATAPCILEYTLRHDPAGRGTSGRVRFPSTTATTSWGVLSTTASPVVEPPTAVTFSVELGDTLTFTGAGSITSITLSGLVSGGGRIEADLATPLRAVSPFAFAGTLAHSSAGSGSSSGLGLLRGAAANAHPLLAIGSVDARSSAVQVGPGAEVQTERLVLDSVSPTTIVVSALAALEDSTLRAGWVNATRGSFALSARSTLWLGDMPRRVWESTDITIPVTGADATARVFLHGTIACRCILAFSGSGAAAVPEGETLTMDVYPPSNTATTTVRMRLEFTGWTFTLPYGSTLYTGTEESSEAASQSLNHRLASARELYLQGSGRMQFLGRVEVVGTITAQLPVPHAPASTTFLSPAALVHIGEGAFASLYNSQATGTIPEFHARVTGPGTLTISSMVRWLGPQRELGPATINLPASAQIEIGKRLTEPLPYVVTSNSPRVTLAAYGDSPKTLAEYGPNVTDTTSPSGFLEIAHVHYKVHVHLRIEGEVRSFIHYAETDSLSSINYIGANSVLRVGALACSASTCSSSFNVPTFVPSNVYQPPVKGGLYLTSSSPTIELWQDGEFPTLTATTLWVPIVVNSGTRISMTKSLVMSSGGAVIVQEGGRLVIPEQSQITISISNNAYVINNGTVEIAEGATLLTPHSGTQSRVSFSPSSTLLLGPNSMFSFARIDMLGWVQYDSSPAFVSPTFACTTYCDVVIDPSAAVAATASQMRIPAFASTVNTTTASIIIRGAMPVVLPTTTGIASATALSVAGSTTPGTLIVEHCDRLVAFPGPGAAAQLLFIGTIAAGCRTSGSGSVLVPAGVTTEIVSNPAQLATLTIPATATLVLRMAGTVSPALTVAGTLVVPAGYAPVLTATLILLPTATLRIEPGATCTLRGGGGSIRGRIDVGKQEDGTGVAAAAAAAGGAASLGILRVESTSLVIVTDAEDDGTPPPAYSTLGSLELYRATVTVSGNTSFSLLLPIVFDTAATGTEASTLTVALTKAASPRFLYRGCLNSGTVQVDSSTVPVEFVSGELRPLSQCGVQGTGILSYPASSTAVFLGPLTRAVRLQIEEGATLVVSPASADPVSGMSHNFSLSHSSATLTVLGKIHLLADTALAISASNVLFSESSTVELEAGATLDLALASGADAGSATNAAITISGSIYVDSTLESTGIVLRNGGLLKAQLKNSLPMLSVLAGTLRVARAGRAIGRLQLASSAALSVDVQGSAALLSIIDEQPSIYASSDPAHAIAAAFFTTATLTAVPASVDWAAEEADPESTVLFVTTLETPTSSAPRVLLTQPHSAIVISALTSTLSPRFVSSSAGARLVLRGTDATPTVMLPAAGLILEGSGILEIATGTTLYTRDPTASSSAPTTQQALPVGWVMFVASGAVLRTGSLAPAEDAPPAAQGVPALTVLGAGLVTVEGTLTTSRIGGDVLLTARTEVLATARVEVTATRALTLTPPASSSANPAPAAFNISVGAELVIDGLLAITTPSTLLLDQPAAIRGGGSVQCKGQSFAPSAMRGDGYLNSCIGAKVKSCTFPLAEHMVTVAKYFSASPENCDSPSPVYFSISPTLPLGLSLDPVTGAVYGTVQELFTTRSYMVTPSNDRGPGDTFLVSLRAVLYDCTAGHYCPSPTQSIACPVGFYCPQNSNSPVSCTSAEVAAGAWCPTSSAAALPCPAGYYCPNPS